MRRRAITLAGLAAAALLCAGCDPYWVLHVETRLEPETQRELDSFPQQILLGREDRRGWAAYRLGVICQPSAEPFVAVARLSGLGCAEPGTVTVWLAPVLTGDALACGPRAEEEWLESAPRPPADAAQASARVFTEGDRCRRRTAPVVLEPR